jgi:hypothetical protein
MSLNQEDFEKLPNVNKKKILINMTSVRQTMLTDPNLMLKERNIQNMLTFAKDNWLFLNQKGKEFLRNEIDTFIISP